MPTCPKCGFLSATPLRCPECKATFRIPLVPDEELASIGSPLLSREIELDRRRTPRGQPGQDAPASPSSPALAAGSGDAPRPPPLPQPRSENASNAWLQPPAESPGPARPPPALPRKAPRAGMPAAQADPFSPPSRPPTESRPGAPGHADAALGPEPELFPETPPLPAPKTKPALPWYEIAIAASAEPIPEPGAPGPRDGTGARPSPGPEERAGALEPVRRPEPERAGLPPEPASEGLAPSELEKQVIRELFETAESQPVPGASAEPSALWPEAPALEVHARPASLLARAVAATADALVLALFLGACVAIARAIVGPGDSGEVGTASWPLLAAPWAALLGALAFVYGTLFQTMGGRTLGKRLLGITVLDASGRPPRLPRSAARTLLTVVSALPLMAGFALALFNRKRQGLHDLVTGTYVVKLVELPPSGSGELEIPSRDG